MAALQSSRLATHHEGKISELQATTINQLNPISSPDLQRSMKRHVLKKSSSTQELRKGDNRMAQMIGSTDENRCVFKRTRNGSNDATVLELPTQRLEEANLSCMIFGTPAKDRIQRELGRSRSLSRLRSRVRPSVDDELDLSTILSNPLQSNGFILECPQPPRLSIRQWPGQRRPSVRSPVKPHRKASLQTRKPINQETLFRRRASVDQITVTVVTEHLQQTLIESPQFKAPETKIPKPVNRTPATRTRSHTTTKRRASGARLLGDKEVRSTNPKTPTTRQVPDEVLAPRYIFPRLAAIPNLSYDQYSSDYSSSESSPRDTTANWPLVPRGMGSTQTSPSMSPRAKPSDSLRSELNPLPTSFVILPIILDDQYNLPEQDFATDTAPLTTPSWQQRWRGPAPGHLAPSRTSSPYKQMPSLRAPPSPARSSPRLSPSITDKPLPRLPFDETFSTPHTSPVLPSPASSSSSAPYFFHATETLDSRHSNPRDKPVRRRGGGRVTKKSSQPQHQHEHRHQYTTSSPDLLSSHFDWEEVNHWLPSKREGGRKAPLSQSCIQFLRKFSFGKKESMI